MVRLLLLALLPVIAVTLYLEGQQYDSALINFQSSSTTPAADFFPRTIDGFNRSGRIQNFTTENLYEYVNGHAEYFISAGFVSLSVGEYIRPESDPDRPEVVVEIYDMGNGIQAFGVFVDETGRDTIEPASGKMAFKSSQGFTLVAGRYYIKIDAYDESAPAVTFGEKIEEKIGATSDLAPFFSRFPALGTVVRTRYIKEGYRGLGFMQNVMEREYSVNGTAVQVFLVTGDTEEIRGLSASFVDYFQDSDVKYHALKENGKTYYKVTDPYEGDWYLLPLNDALFGVYGAADSRLIKPLLEGAETRALTGDL